MLTQFAIAIPTFREAQGRLGGLHFGPQTHPTGHRHVGRSSATFEKVYNPLAWGLQLVLASFRAEAYFDVHHVPS